MDHTLLDEMEAIFEERGWWDGGFREPEINSVCLGQCVEKALIKLYGTDARYHDLQMKFMGIINSLFPYPTPGGKWISIPSWNDDSPNRTFEDVQLVLKHARAEVE